VGSGASFAIWSRTIRISSRSPSSAASFRTSAAIEERARRLAAASRSAVRTASESLSPSLRITPSAATETFGLRADSDGVINAALIGHEILGSDSDVQRQYSVIV
jgi:hypothetical protein